MFLVYEGTERRHSHNNLVDTAGGFSLHTPYTYVPPPLKKYKEYSCAFPTFNILKDIWCELILQVPQNQEVTGSFYQLKLVLKTHGACTMQEECVQTSPSSNNIIFH